MSVVKEKRTSSGGKAEVSPNKKAKVAKVSSEKIIKTKKVEKDTTVKHAKKIKAKKPSSKSPEAKKNKKLEEKDPSEVTDVKKVKSKKAKSGGEKTDKQTALKNKVKAKHDKAKEAPKTKAEMRGDQKQLREERRKKKSTKKEENIFDLGIKAKKVWEEARREDCTESRREELLTELHSLIKGNVSKIIHAHDTVRVVECLVALGSSEIKNALYTELKDELLILAKSKYASFFVQKLIKYGSKEQRNEVFKILEGRIADLTKHKIANGLVELAYNDYANASQRNRFLQEFFGPEFRHFKEDTARTVLEVLDKFPEKKRDVVKNLGVNVHTLITKGCYNHSLVHTVMYNYMLALNSLGESGHKDRAEFIGQLRDVCVHIVHSQDGARLAMNAIWHGTAKDRKAIIKSFKTFVPKIAKEEHGHLVLQTILDCVDDTKYVSKAIVGELLENLEDIVESEYGKKVLIFLVNARNKTYFHPDYLANLAKGDGNANTKKDPELRREEHVAAAAASILDYIQSHLGKMLQDNSCVLLLGALLSSIPKTEKKLDKVLTKIAEKVCEPFVPGDGDNLIENSAVHRLLKKLMSIEGFVNMILEQLEPETVTSCLECNRGAFLFVAMIESENKDVNQAVVNYLKPYAKHIKKQTHKGAEILKKKLL